MHLPEAIIDLILSYKAVKQLDRIFLQFFNHISVFINRYGKKATLDALEHSMQDYEIVKREQMDSANAIHKADSPRPLAVKKDIKKMICPLHQRRLTLKCNYERCKEPLVCTAYECMEMHFHDQGKIIMSRFDGEKFSNALQVVTSSKDKLEGYFAKSIQIKSQLDAFRSSLNGLFIDLKTMNSLFQTIHSSLDQALNRAFLGTLNNTISLEQKISKAIQTLKTSIVIPYPEAPSILPQARPSPRANEPMNSGVKTFLEAYIPHYRQQKVHTLFEGKLTSDNVQTFHSLLANKDNLIFLIQGPSILIGSYFQAPYPVAASPAVRDTNSFIFVSDPDSPGGFARFIANPDANQHLRISEVFGICQGHCNGDGVRLNVLCNELQFYLPSQSFVSQRQGKIIEGSTEALEVRVLQIESGLD